MEVFATASFNKDISKLKDITTARKIEKLIAKLQGAESLNSIAGIKKLSGSLNAYRIRIGDYRIGFYKENNTIKLTAFAHRKEIYRYFP